MPRTADICARVPPHVRDEFNRLKDSFPPSARQPSAGDLVGALLLAARRSPETVASDLSIYFDIKADWERDGVERLPEI
jgi:hypothetical protein